MSNHWPILAAVILIALAVLLGLWDQNEKAEIAARRIPVSQMTPADTPAPPTPAPARPADTLPAPAAKPATPPAKPATPTQPVTPAAPQTPTPFGTPTPLAPLPTPVQPAPLPTPVQPAPQPPKAMVDPRTTILQTLRTELQARIGTPSLDLAGGGFALNTDGARVEVQPLPNWNINIYNNNAQKPEVETEGFKRFYEVVTTGLGIDTQQKAITTDNGKSYLKTNSKLGSVSLVRDPANGNSCLIRPLGQLAPIITKPAVVERPAPPAPAPPPPAPAPAKPPGKEDF